MQPFNNNFLPLSVTEAIAYRELCLTQAAPPSTQPSSCPDAGSQQQHMLAALTARSAEVESAEWSLDQSVSVRDEQIVAALSAGLPAEHISAASGLTVPELEQIVDTQTRARDRIAS